MGDGEGDAQKKATLDTLLHKITNDFQCQCLCPFDFLNGKKGELYTALKTLN